MIIFISDCWFSTSIPIDSKLYKATIVQPQKSFRRLLGPIQKGLRKPPGLIIFRRFHHYCKFPAAFGNIKMGIFFGFLKLHCHCTKNVQENQQELVNFFKGTSLKNNFKYFRNQEIKFKNRHWSPVKDVDL
jgi:hypothetical protein